jgi:hypothetical protein
MPTGLLVEWIKEAKTEIKALSEKYSSFREGEYEDLKVAFEKLRTEVRTRNRIIWGLIGVMLTLLGLILGLK